MCYYTSDVVCLSSNIFLLLKLTWYTIIKSFAKNPPMGILLSFAHPLGNNALHATRSASIFHLPAPLARRIVAKISKTMSKLSAYLHWIGVFEMTGAVTGAPLSQTHKSLSGRTKPLSLFPRLLKQHTFWHIYGPCCSFDIHR